MVREAMVGLLLAWVGLAACSGKTIGGDEEQAASGGTSSKPPPSSSPPKQCQALASTWCSKAFGCYVQVGRLAQSQLKANVDQCVKLAVDHAPCSEVTSVSAEYNTCISQINAMACTKWNVPQEQFGAVSEPASCEYALAFD